MNHRGYLEEISSALDREDVKLPNWFPRANIVDIGKQVRIFGRGATSIVARMAAEGAGPETVGLCLNVLGARLKPLTAQNAFYRGKRGDETILRKAVLRKEEEETIKKLMSWAVRKTK